jgi:hypothetical protein
MLPHMLWFMKKKKLEAYQDPVVAAERMHRFLVDATALKPYIETSQEAFNAYHTALNGMRMACQDYCRTLKEQGLMSR